MFFVNVITPIKRIYMNKVHIGMPKRLLAFIKIMTMIIEMRRSPYRAKYDPHKRRIEASAGFSQLM